LKPRRERSGEARWRRGGVEDEARLQRMGPCRRKHFVGPINRRTASKTLSSKTSFKQ